MLIRVLRLAVHVDRPACKLLHSRIQKKIDRERGRRKRQIAGKRGGEEGYKWSRASGGHGNDLWLIVVTDRHGA